MPTRRAIAPVLLLLMALLCLPASWVRADKDAPLDLGATLPVDPAVERTGTLDNGFTFWIRRHGMPAGKVTLLLHVDSGSLQEEEEQRGLAHFLEHLAFNGSEHFPPGEVVRYFESLGMTFGTHQNAFTSFDQTTYMLSLPDTKAPTIEKALLFLTDVAHRLTIAPDEVEKERGVILEEARAREGVRTRVMKKALALFLPGARLARRLPIGDLDVVRNAPPEQIRAYYETWYRPDRSTLIVVGDVDPTAVEPLVRQAFADWKAKDPAPADVDPGIADVIVIDAGVITDPEQAEAQILLTTVRPEPPLQSIGDFRCVLVERLGRSIFNRRLMTLQQENEVVFTGGGGIDRGQALGGYLLGGVGLTAPPDQWPQALKQAVEEIRRFRQYGIAGQELKRAKDAVRAEIEQAAQTAGDVPAMGVAMQLNEALSWGRPPMSAAQRRDLAARLLPGIEVEEVVAAFRNQINPANALVLLILPEKEGVRTPAKQGVLRIVLEALVTKVEKRAIRADVGTILEKDPEPGAVTSRVHDETFGVTSLTLENGVRVHIKPMPNVEAVHVQINLIGGLVEESARNRGITEAAAVAFESGRLATKHHAPADLSLYLEPLQVNVSGGVGDAAVALNVWGTADALPAGLRLAHLLLKEPRVDPVALENWRRELEPKLAQLKVSIPLQGLLTLRSIASGGDVRLALPTMEDYAKITPEAAQAWLDRLVSEAPIEIAIAGGIETAEAERLARVFFGSLPKRPDRGAEIRALRKVKTIKGPVVKNVGIETVTPVAMVLLGWRGVSSDDAPRQIVLAHAGTILTTRLLRVVREEKGLTYSIGSGYQITEYEGLDGLLVQFTTAPAKATEAAKVAKEVVLALAKDGPTDDEITSTERQMANALDEQMQLPAFWLLALSKLHANGRTLDDMKARLAALRKMDRELLLETLGKVLVDERLAQVIVKPAGS